MKEISELIIEYKGIITLVFSVIGASSLVTFFTSHTFERQFYSKENKFLYTLLNYFLLFVLSPTLIFISWSKSTPILMGMLYKIFLILIIIDLFLILFLVIKKKTLTKRAFFNFFVKIKLNKIILNPILNILIIFLYLILTITICGFANAIIILSDFKTKTLLVVIALTVCFELFIIFISLHYGTDARLTKPEKVIIKMDNGDIFENYYIYNPTKNNFLLIGKEVDSIMCSEPVLIPINKIASCKKVNHIIQDHM